MKKFLFVLMLAFISFSLVACAEIGVGGNAPEISAASWLNGNGIKLADCKDKYVVVEFWATWCPPCRKSIPHLKSMNAKYKDKNVIFVSLTDEDKATVTAFNEKSPTKMDWLVGTGSESGSDYRVRGIPHAFIVKDGKVIWQGHPMDGLEEKLAELTK